jgi:O-antigen/teichoic acid export membrane protein
VPPTGETATAKVAAVTARRRHLGGGVLASTASQVVTLFATAVTSVLIARILGADGLGAFALAASFAAASVLVVGLGVKQGIVVLVGSGSWPLRAVAADLILPLLVLGALGAAIVVGTYEILRDSALDPIPAAVVPVLAGAAWFALASQWSWSLALALERYEAYAIVFVAAPVAVLVLSPSLALPFGTEGAIVGLAAGQAVAGLLGLGWALRSGTGWRPRETAADRRQRLRSAFRFGVQSWSSEILRYGNLRLDLFILAAFASSADVGKYSVAVSVAGIGLILPVALATAVLPRTARLQGASLRGEVPIDDADLSDARACRHTVLMLPLSALVVSVLLVVGIPVLYGGEFHRAIALGLVLLPGVLLLGLAQVMTAIVQGRGRPDYALYAVLLTAPPTVAAYLLVIPDAGAMGAALVSLCSYAASALVAFYFFRRTTGIGGRTALVPKGEELGAYRDVVALTRDYVRR